MAQGKKLYGGEINKIRKVFGARIIKLRNENNQHEIVCKKRRIARNALKRIGDKIT